MGYEPAQYGMGFAVDPAMLEADDLWQCIFKNRCAGFKGRRYRRGKHRCRVCGAKR